MTVFCLIARLCEPLAPQIGVPPDTAGAPATDLGIIFFDNIDSAWPNTYIDIYIYYTTLILRVLVHKAMQDFDHQQYDSFDLSCLFGYSWQNRL